MATAERVIREANLIARQFECLGPTRAVEATATHIRTFWAPLLRMVLLEQVREHGERFSSIAAQAVGMTLRMTTNDPADGAGLG